MTELGDTGPGEDLPPQFAEAYEQVCALIEQLDSAGIPADTMIAALMTVLMPRLVEAYGPGTVATMLNRLAREVENGGELQ